MTAFTLHLGDCIEVMRTLADNSVDSIVCDPPYGLEFMGKEWDGADGFRRSLNKADVGRENVFGRASRTSPEYRAGHLFQEWCEAWATEALRVLKPGGHLLAFSGSRTYHRMAVAIEDAGFEIRDQIMWVYGSGFPKSLDVSKAIDKAAPRAGMFDGFAKHYAERRAAASLTHNAICAAGRFHGEHNHGGASANWESGNSVPTSDQWTVLKPLLGLSNEWLPLIERVEAERSVVGKRRTGPGVAFSSEGPTELDITTPATDAARQWEGWGTALKPAHEPICVARKPLVGTVAANVLQFGTGAINIDGCRVGTDGGTTRGENGSNAGKERNVLHGGNFGIEKLDAGRWPANLIHDGSAEVVALFPDSNGSGPARTLNRGKREEDGWGMQDEPSALRDAGSGSAARFFYCAKASKADRNSGLDRIVEVIIEWSQSLESKEWESEARRVQLLVDTEQSPLRVIGVSGAENRSATEWNTMLFGSDTTGQSPKATTSTTRMKTSSTTISGILSYFQNFTTNGSTPAANCAMESGGSHAENAGSSSLSLTTTNAAMASALGASNAALPVQLKISASAAQSRHPTVKPTDLMAYLCRLVTPPGGLVLDPFMGSGSTGKACMREGFRFVGIDMTPEYVEIARARIAHELARVTAAAEAAAEKAAPTPQLDLFA